jgi:hypothetical protein
MGISADEQTLLATILDAGRPAQEAPTLENALGLIDPAGRTPTVEPQRLPVRVDTPAARACLVLLDELIEQQRATPVIATGWRGSDEQLLGNMSRLPSPDTGITAQEDQANLPLAEMWLQWDRERPAASRDDDGLELVRALLLLSGTRATRGEAASATTDAAVAPEATILDLFANAALAGLEAAQVEWLPAAVVLAETGVTGAQPTVTKVRDRLRRGHLVNAVLGWLVRLQDPSPAGAVDLLLDSLETALALIPRRKLEEWVAAQATAERWRYGLDDPRGDGSRGLLAEHIAQQPGAWTAAHHARYWRLLHWLDQPLPGAPRWFPPLAVALRAQQDGEASEADLLEHLVASAAARQAYGRAQAHSLQLLSARQAHPLVVRYRVLQRLIPQLRERILEIEMARGEMPTPATAPALALRYAGGLEVFARVLGALASADLVRGYLAATESRAGALSHLLRATYPTPEDTPEVFARRIAEAGIEHGRLVAAAVYAPQWARHVEQALGWPRLEEAVWWLHAHSKDDGWSVDQALREAWQAQVAERTPLSARDLMDGAVDVEWFWRSYQELGAERWNQLYAAAKYASSGGGHAWARLSADAMTGAIEAAELMRRITGKRNQGAVRALGLLPLPAGADEREAAVRERYQAIQEFVRTGRQFGAQRRASEELAARIGLENLARAAGYADPIRLQWAMEAQLAADLRDGPVVVADGGVQVMLSLDPLSAEPEIAVSKSGRRLKTLPARLKKNEAIAALYARKREIERQVSRMRRSLEDAMCRGDHFTAAEVAGLLRHPVLSRLLRNLVFVEDNSADGQPDVVLGYPVAGGEQEESAGTLLFRAHDGTARAIAGTTANLRLAHPHDLLRGGAWHAWQHDCFASERIQPFKQVFRELYVLTQNETRVGDEAASSRYSGQQVQPRQALALFGQRGWVNSQEEGVRRTFHDAGLTARVDFNGGYLTPAEVEGLTIDRVSFTRRGTWTPLPLVEVPPRIFSEVMRDLDLVVSVAHRGGVDPEASASTVEMRAALLQETCALLRLQNVSLRSAHALIEGTLGSYSVHMGSAVVHRQPGGALCIVPVHSQHRGRLFLPFADDDPRTAEVVSKVVLLARDGEIKDPSILEQIL